MDRDRLLARFGLGLAAIGRPAYITLGRDDDLGGDRRVEVFRDRAHVLLDAAWDAGVRYFDAARSYGLAESFLGSWLAAHPGRRPELRIGSKWGYRYVGDWRMDAPVHERKDHSLATFEEQWPQTLATLGTTPDVYLIHSLTPDSPALGDAALLDRLRALADDGVTVGFSTSGPSQGELLESVLDLDESPFSAVQTTWNLLEPSAGRALARAHDAGWLVVVKETLANGRLTERGGVHGVLDRAAADGQTPDAFGLGAVLAQPWADVVLTGAVTPEQLASNLAARPPRITVDAEQAFAVPPADYWRERSDLSWG
ncbi:aldo/keto reductase [Amnibacterium flavum]|uniref:Aldo/keto reductase n=2 Tax=Amnibacterium flavum TaxID=2173173 RepID=A0A2V1HU79_9MICO|nr:aldo/keto reductase [Amnibacterium flavum]